MREIAAEIEIGLPATRLFDLVAAEWEEAGVREPGDGAPSPARLAPGFRTRWAASTLALPADVELRISSQTPGCRWEAVSTPAATLNWRVSVLATSAHTSRVRYRLAFTPPDLPGTVHEICLGRRRRVQRLRLLLAQLKVRAERAEALRRLNLAAQPPVAPAHAPPAP